MHPSSHHPSHFSSRQTFSSNNVNPWTSFRIRHCRRVLSCKTDTASHSGVLTGQHTRRAARCDGRHEWRMAQGARRKAAQWLRSLESPSFACTSNTVSKVRIGVLACASSRHLFLNRCSRSSRSAITNVHSLRLAQGKHDWPHLASQVAYQEGAHDVNRTCATL